MVKCWKMTNEFEDQRRECHREPKEFVPLDYLKSLGVKYEYICPQNYKEKLDNFAKLNGYSNRDEVKVSRETLPNFEYRMREFFDEHLHIDDEIRFMLDGLGYFDVRDRNEEWIRIQCEPGDLLTFPAGIYHRFTVTLEEYVHAVRLFHDEPVWTPYSRSEASNNLPERKNYVKNVLNKD